jgi:hypothetical protein
MERTLEPLQRRRDRTLGMTGRSVDFAIERADVDEPMQTSTWCSLVDVPPGREIPAAD